jgi:hypothetical protein
MIYTLNWLDVHLLDALPFGVPSFAVSLHKYFEFGIDAAALY